MLLPSPLSSPNGYPNKVITLKMLNKRGFMKKAVVEVHSIEAADQLMHKGPHYTRSSPPGQLDQTETDGTMYVGFLVICCT